MIMARTKTSLKQKTIAEKEQMYADVVVNIRDNSELCYKTKSKYWIVKNSTMNKDVLKSVCNLLLSEDSLLNCRT